MIKLVVEKSALEAGLTKLKDVWSDVEVNPSLKFVLFTVAEKEVTLRASNLSMTAEVRFPLYEKSSNVGTFGIIGKEILDIVKLADSLISMDVSDTHVCTVKTKGFEWVIRGVKDFPLGDGFKELVSAPASKVEMSREILLKGLRVCQSCMSDDPSASNMYGIKFGPSSAESTDAHRIALFRKGSPGINFTVPTPAVPTLKTILDLSAVEKVSLRYNSNQVELTAGLDVLVFGQMSDFVNVPALVKDLEVFSPKFEVDKQSFILGVKRAGILGDDKTYINLTRAGEDLIFTTYKGADKAGEGVIRVSWKFPEPSFAIKLNWKVFKDVVNVLDTEVVKLGVGTFRGNDFCRLDEEDKTLFVLSMTK